jgi:hypothetical protein
MAVHSFKNAGAGVAISGATIIYSCPGSTQATVHSLSIANVKSSGSAAISIYLNDGGYDWTILKDAVIEEGNSLVWDKPINLTDTDLIKVAGVAGEVEAFASILEIS